MWPRKNKQDDSEIALSEAQEQLARIKRRGPEVKAVTEASRRLLERNHLVERLEHIFGG